MSHSTEEASKRVWFINLPEEVEAVTPQDRIAELERENAALRQALADMPTCRCGLSIDEQCALSVENAALRADKERLDWLTNTGCWLTFPVLSRHRNWKQGTARDVIDAARKEAQP